MTGEPKAEKPNGDDFDVDALAATTFCAIDKPPDNAFPANEEWLRLVGYGMIAAHFLQKDDVKAFADLDRQTLEALLEMTGPWYNARKAFEGMAYIMKIASERVMILTARFIRDCPEEAEVLKWPLDSDEGEARP